MTKSIYSVYIKQHIQYNCLIEKKNMFRKTGRRHMPGYLLIVVIPACGIIGVLFVFL